MCIIDYDQIVIMTPDWCCNYYKLPLYSCPILPSAPYNHPYVSEQNNASTMVWWSLLQPSWASSVMNTKYFVCTCIYNFVYNNIIIIYILYYNIIILLLLYMDVHCRIPKFGCFQY